MNRALMVAGIGFLTATFGYLGYGVFLPLRDAPPLAVGQNLSGRPAAKSTCPQAIVTQPPPGMELSDRELVPFSSTKLGVNTVFSDITETAGPPSRSRTIEVVSGGYVDDLTESYDDLRPIRTISVAGQPVSLLAGSLLTSTVKVVIWRQPGVAPPCDVHAVLATNLSNEQFMAAVKSVRVESPSPTSRSANDANRYPR
jgi:hypothetical protein